MRISTVVRGVAVVVLAAALTACAGLPTSGPVQAGLPVGDVEADSPFTERASSPISGAGPEVIVAGFLEASITPTDNWSIAREFLTSDLADTWRPGAGITIDVAGSRSYASSVDTPEELDSADEADVRVDLDQRASVDADGRYTEAAGDTELAFRLERDDDGEWRIASAPDGIVLDEGSFQQVYSRYSLQYYDQSWRHLVPDVRWYPRGSNVATSITQAAIEGTPSDWLQPAVHSAFPADVLLDGNSVPVTEQVASVALTDAALSLDAATLARMRTQLEKSLAATGVSEVRFTVNGSELDADEAGLASDSSDVSTIVLTEDGFGSLVGGEVTPIAGITEPLAQFDEPVSAIDLAQGEGLAAVQLSTGAIWAITNSKANELDARPGLVEPSIDPYGYIWSAPTGDPQDVHAWTEDVTSPDIVDAWPEASAISALRVSTDGVRIAALVTIGGRQSVVTAVILRDDSNVPTGFGPTHEVVELSTPAQGLVWLGADSLGILTEGDEAALRMQIVGGPGSEQTAPNGSASFAGAKSPAGVRILGADGTLFAPRASAWQEFYQGVLVLGTRAGY
ncbi:LpqB family beta-propeller domain-containing protein [Microbacterium sp. NPDC056234]|uniref:LpqB family beta-propeller domain-containing protein n=1 Tax=Microbacterium sp. NPDC056234 TaxID=3345757 RepID=UPI0035D8430C